MRGSRMVRLAIGLGGLASLAGAGCGTSRDAAPPAVMDPLGEWRVVGHRLPGASALTDSAATARHGTRVRYGAHRAIAGVDTCRHAVYHTRSGPCDSLLATRFRVGAAELGVSPPDGRMAVTCVYCGDEPWASLGGVLLWIEPDRAYSPCDGAFFELRRDADGGAPH